MDKSIQLKTHRRKLVTINYASLQRICIKQYPNPCMSSVAYVVFDGKKKEFKSSFVVYVYVICEISTKAVRIVML